MHTLKNCKLLGLCLLLVAGLAACDRKPGPAESVGQKIDLTANDAGNKIGETIDRIGNQLDEQSAKTGAAIDDAEITTKVKAAIFAEPGLQTLQISVDTVKSDVTLSGSVDTPANSERAKGLAAAVSGVRSVDNRLVLKSN